MAHDLSQEALEARKRAQAAAAAAEQVGEVGHMLSSQPEHVIYANAAMTAVQADGMIVLRFEYHSPDGERPLVEVIVPPAVFAQGIVANAHQAMADASQQLVLVAGTVAEAVAKRAAAFGGRAPMPSAEQIARDRRRAAGDA